MKAEFREQGSEGDRNRDAVQERTVGGKSCGSCSLCCKVFDLPEFQKPADAWCRHCRPGKGCAIHGQERPNGCTSYRCMWLSSELPEKWKPDRCKFVLTEQASLNRVQVAVDCNFPDAWRKEPFYTQFRLWARQGTIVSVFVGDRVTHLLPNGEEKVGK